MSDVFVEAVEIVAGPWTTVTRLTKCLAVKQRTYPRSSLLLFGSECSLMFAGELVRSLTPLTNKTANISAMFALVIRQRSSLIFALVIRQRMFAHVRWWSCSFDNAANEHNSEHIRYVLSCYSAVKFTLVIRQRINVRERRKHCYVCEHMIDR